MSAIIKTENLNCIYGGSGPLSKVALSDINIEIEKGRVVGIIGHTGSGKSTLISHFNGLLTPTSGKITVDGEDITALKNKRHIRYKVGLCFQYPEHQLFEETVYKDIAFGPKNKGLPEDDIEKCVKNAIEFVGLSESYLSKSPFSLSGGEKRRVAIAGIIAMDPDVLILDEPTAGLDPKGRNEILGNIKKYHDEKHNTVVLVSHSMEDIALYCDDVIVLNKGRVLLSGTKEEVFSQTELLISAGLDIPQIARLFSELRMLGYDLPASVFSVERAAEEIIRLKEGGSK